MTGGAENFSETVEAARQRFLVACDRIGLRVWSYPSALTQPDGKPLMCDVARLGSPDAKRIVVLCSSAGGPAGLLGCGAAHGMVTKDGLVDLPREVGVIVIHAANPRGPIWPISEDDIPVIGDTSEPVGWTDAFLTAAEQRLEAYRATNPTAPPETDTDKLIDWERMAGRTLTSMAPPAWDMETIRAIARDRIPKADQICLIDPRTGPGPYGKPTVVACDPDRSAGRERAERWFTIDVTENAQQRDRAVGVGNAPCAGGLGGLISAGRVTSIVLEIGTYSMAGVLSPPGGGWRDAITPFPSAPEWRRAAWTGIRDTLRQAYGGMMRS